MPLISVTRLRLRRWRFLPEFFFYAMRSSWQARRSKGNLGSGVFNDANNTYWTRTAWIDEAAMKAYIIGKPHVDAMKKLPYWCDEAATVHWEQESASLPEWKEAHRRLVAEGRRSKVMYPSLAHEAFEIPLPKGSSGALQKKS